MSDHFADFVEAARRGRVVMHDRYDRLQPANLFDFSGAIPHIDFGTITFDEEQMNALGQPYDEALNRVYDNPISFPFDEFAIVYEGPKFIEVLLITSEPGMNVFHLRSYGKRTSQNHWVSSYEVATLDCDTGAITFRGERYKELDFDFDLLGKVVQEEYQTVMICLALLSMESTKRESCMSERLASVNRGRAKGKLPPIPDTIRITLGKPTVTSSASIGATGITQRPHDRRGHVRRLKSGRIVPVRAYSVHGGSGVTRRYEVSV